MVYRLAMGKKRRDDYLFRKGVDFRQFLYRTLKTIGLENKLILEVPVPEYGYRILCPINAEDLMVVTRHEEEIIHKYFKPKKGDIVVDVGAHFGRYTLIAAGKIGSGRVFAVEAHPGNFKMLKRNLRLNRSSNVTALEYAAYSKKMPLKLYLPDEDLGYTMHHSVNSSYLVSKYSAASKVEEHFAEVRADTLDNLLDVEQINWLKIDVEGAELEVLKGAQMLIRRSNDLTVLVEVHGQDTYAPLLEFFNDNGISIEHEKTYSNAEKHVIATRRQRTFAADSRQPIQC